MRLLLLMFAFCLTLPAYAELRYTLQPRQIADDVWLLEGSTDNFDKANGGNIVNTGFIVTAAGVVVIDSGPSRRYGEAMRAAIASVTDRPVIKLLLTHHHPDHVLGNQAFADVPIAALAGTTDLLREQGNAMAENMYRLVGDWMRGTEVVLPSETLAPGTLEIGGRSLRLLALRGHTGADLAILGQDPQQYDAYAVAIRKEYAAVPEPVYREHRARALRTLLEKAERADLFTDAWFASLYSDRARDNLVRDLESLK